MRSIEQDSRRDLNRTIKIKIRRPEMFDEAADARIRAHRNNIRRHRGLLETRVSDLERDFIVRRLAEKESKLGILLGTDASAAAIVGPRANVPDASITVTT